MSTIPDGTLLHSRYRVLRVVGTGGVATVYRATDEQLGRDVALKVIAHGPVGSAELQRVEDEVRLIAGLSHPALVTLFDVLPDEAASTSTLVMQFVDGEDLSARIAQGALAPSRVAAIGAAVAGALAFVHESGVIHRDVKPANILLPSSGPQPALLADFGIARLVDSASITATGTIIGTASYLSPEQAKGSQLAGSSDVYSLGLVLLEGLTGQRAFPGNALETVAARITNDPTIPGSVGREWTSLLERMLHRDPESRLSAAQVETALVALDGPTRTLLLPVTDAPTERLAADAPTERLAAEAPTELLAAAAAPSPAAKVSATPAGVSRRPPRRVLVVAILIVALLAVVAALALAGRGEISATPPSTEESSTSPTSAPTVEPLAYPQVDGELGDRLATLQEAVGAVGDEEVARQLGEQVLVISTAAAAGDYELALSALDDLADRVDDAQLSSSDRESITKASESVRQELDSLLKDADQPGKSDDKPGKN